MNKFVRDAVRKCDICARFKGSKYEKPLLKMAKYPTARFTTINVDFLGPLIEDNGFKNIFIIIDRASRRIVAVPCRTQTTQEVIEVLWDRWFSYYGVPRVLVSDGGPCFKAVLFRGHPQKLGVRHQITLAYESHLNGLAEGAVKRIKTALKTQPNSHQWVRKLPFITLAIANMIGNDGISPSLCLHGSQLRLPNTMYQLDETTRDDEHLKLLKEFGESFDTRVFRRPPEGTVAHNKDLDRASSVYVRRGPETRGLQSYFIGPFPLVGISGITCTIIRNGRKIKVAISRVKPCYNNLFDYIENKENAENDKAKTSQENSQIIQPSSSLNIDSELHVDDGDHPRDFEKKAKEIQADPEVEDTSNSFLDKRVRADGKPLRKILRRKVG